MFKFPECIAGWCAKGMPVRMQRMERLDNVQIYERLHRIAREVDAMAERAWSVTGQTALRVVATLIRRVASATFASTLTTPQKPAERVPPP